MLILLGTEEMGSGGRRRRPTVCEELRRRRRRPIDWSSRIGRPFFYGGFHWRLRAISERAYCFKFLFGNVFLHSFVCFFFCLLSLGLRRLMILVKLVLICYFWFDLPFYFVLGYTFGFHSMGKIAAGFLMIRFERLEKLWLWRGAHEFTYVIFRLLLVCDVGCWRRALEQLCMRNLFVLLLICVLIVEEELSINLHA